MYSYYGLSACGPSVQRFLWWKKYLTVFQMIQFVMIFTHAFQLVLYTSCDFPKVFALWIGAHGVLFWFLFSNFYDKAYNHRDGKDGKSEKSSVSSSAAAFVGICSGKQHLLHEKSNGHTTNGHKNGYTNGLSQRNGVKSNGESNGRHTNGYSNGKTNGIKVD